MLMDANLTAAGNPHAELGVHPKSRQTDEHELEHRIKILDKLVDSIPSATDQVSSSGKAHVFDLVNDLRVKINANRNLVRVARLLSEPARESMFSKVRNSLEDLEGSISSQLGVKRTSAARPM
jgi:hypothetical protein